jgi:hypothetical protein
MLKKCEVIINVCRKKKRFILTKTKLKSYRLVVHSANSSTVYWKKKMPYETYEDFELTA